MLAFSRHALALRRDLQTGEQLSWHDGPAQLLHVSRPGGWHVLTNFGPTPIDLPEGEVLLSNRPLVEGRLPADTTVWLRVADPRSV